MYMILAYKYLRWEEIASFWFLKSGRTSTAVKAVNSISSIGVGRFRILGGQGLEYWGEGGKGGQMSRRHMTS